MSQLNSKCTLCYGAPLLTFAHISSLPHRSLVQKLPPFFWRIPDKDIYKFVHKKK